MRANYGQGIYRLLQTFGVTLLLAGLFYYCAFNFQAIPPSVKLSALMSLFFVAMAGFYLARNNALISQLCLFIGVFLIGIFWAVFGQIYQTGADSYMLFLGWGAMALPFVLLKPQAPLIALLVIILELLIFLFAIQVELPSFIQENYQFIPMLLLPFSLLFMKNKAKWLTYFLTLAVLSLATYIIYDRLFKGYHILDPQSKTRVAIFAFALTCVLALLYRYKWHDLGLFTLAVFTLTVQIHCALIAYIDSVVRGFMSVIFSIGFSSIALYAIPIFIIKSAYERQNSHD
jgi:uncharacterized membrane protein